MTEAAGRFAGMTTEDAQSAIVDELDALGLIVAREELVHTVPFSHRSGRRIEPLISLQWFMRMDELAPPAIEAVTSGAIAIHPESQSRRYVDWLENIRPWCVSRQLWWGHQLPVYYRGEETHVGAEPPEGEGWERDPDVLDTWFSSGLWPFATLGWPQDTPELRAFYPTDVLSTARDILFLWVARMVMLGLRFTGEIPFRHVYVHSVIQAPDGRRMSKSLGTGIDPLVEIDQHGADAVRFGLLAMSSTQDVRYSAEKIEQGQRLANKLFNAARLILGTAIGEEAAPRPETVEDRWILSRLERAKAEAAQRIDEFDFAKLSLGLYDFVYGELCDWYLELIKGREATEELSATLLHVLRETLLLTHPVIPFVTEEVWANVPGTEGLLAQALRGPAAPALVDEAAEAQVGRLIETVRAIRAWREDNNVRDVILAREAGLGEVRDAIARLARLEWGEPDGEVVTVGGLELSAPRGRRRRGAARPRRRARPARGRDRPRRREARQRGLRGQGAGRTSSTPSARSSIACGPSWRPCSDAAAGRRRGRPLDRAGRRALPPRPRAVRHALRPGPDAAHAHRAGPAAGAVRLDPRRRHERQDVDRPHDRRPAAVPRPAHGRLSVAAPRLVRRAHPHRRCRPLRRPPGRRGPARRPRRRDGRPHARGRRPRHPVRGADRRRAVRARRAASRRRGDRGRPSAAATTPPTCSPRGCRC